MLNEQTIEKRLATLEQTVVQLQRKLAAPPDRKNWLTTLMGSISDESALTEALEHGRAFRQSDKPY